MTHDHAGHDHAEPHDHSSPSGHEHSADHQHAADGHHHHAAEGAPEAIAECPVMPGTTVNRAEAEELGLVREYEGTRYYLCCESCAALWDSEPARYAAA